MAGPMGHHGSNMEQSPLSAGPDRLQDGLHERAGTARIKVAGHTGSAPAWRVAVARVQGGDRGGAMVPVVSRTVGRAGG
jgi:hypothetical protein